MNYNKIKEALTAYESVHINTYISYLKQVETEKDRQTGQPKNKWFAYFKEDDAIELFEKVAKDNIYIDGVDVTIQNKGKVMVSYNYQAYKNRLLNVYPETKFDIQLVHKGDAFEFNKESGKVYYTHSINNPFELKKEIIGAYCIIKNSKGEFIEILNMDEVAKMRAVATTDKIWAQWFGEMCLKSVMKRACKRHFKDVVHNIEQMDNENYDFEMADLEATIKGKIDEAETLDKLTEIYKAYTGKTNDEKLFISYLGNRKEQLKLVHENS